jgi:hypothetical protein
MDPLTFENLDLACAKVGKNIAEGSSKEPKNLITNALAVLEEQGMYALFLYLKAQGKETGKTVSDKLHDFLKNTPRQSPLLSMDNNDIFSALQELGANLDNLLLARDLVRQSLVYARHHAQLCEDGETKP